jgi:hypothetical protein
VFETTLEKASMLSWERSVEFPSVLPGFASVVLLQKLSAQANETLQGR